MRKEEYPERVALLKKLGFEEAETLGPSFCSPVWALDAQMLVQGTHATDRCHILYACEQTEAEVLEGLFYAPSLLEYLLTDYLGEWSPERMLKEINRQTDTSIRLVDVGGIPMLFTRIDDRNWKESDLRFQISDMLKLIGQLDYLLPRKWKRLLAKRRAGNRYGETL